MSLFPPQTNDLFIVGCDNYSLPSHLREHIDLIKPTVHFNHQPSPNALLKRTEGLSRSFSDGGPKQASYPKGITPSLENCDKIITPDCLHALYNINYTPKSTDKNTFAIGSLRCIFCPPNIHHVTLQLKFHLKHF